ncbi:PEP-CTERM sorting domain-containing protein [Methylobacillus pratensis]
MNIKMKALIAAAVAAMSVSGAANAALTTGATGNSSLVLAVWDVTNKVSVTFDLGFDYAGFSAGSTGSSTSFSWDLTSGSYADVWNVLGGDNLLWGVVATDYNGSITEAGSMGFISTVKEGQSLSSTLAMAQFGRPMAKFDEYLVDNNEKGNVASAGNAYAGTFFTGSKLFNFGPVVLDAVGNEQGVVQYFSAVGAAGRLTYVEYDATFKLDANGLLTYTVAAIPEPETYALLLAGLGLVGAAARRRKST